MNKENFKIQMVKHENYSAYIEASSQEEAEQLAAEYTSQYNWDIIANSQTTEICCENGEYLIGECIC